MNTTENRETRKSELRPPDAMAEFVGGGDFEQVGETFLDFLIEFGELQPHEQVLDVGCGCGRIAIPMTRYLNSKGRYEGFDIYKDGIRWCSKAITSRFPSFRFQFVDIFNKRYNPTGKLSACTFRFPYKSGSFDLVVLSSVFTHLKRTDMLNYLSEVSRVLRKGGRCLVTFFLFNEEDSREVDPRRSNLDFRFDCESYRTVSKEEVEFAIAYEEEYIRRQLIRNGLRVKEPIQYGLQDIVVAAKLGGPLTSVWHLLQQRIRRFRQDRNRVPGEDIREEGFSGPLLPLNGIWTDPTQTLNLFVQTYEPRSCVIIATLDGVGFIAFRQENIEDGIRIPMDAGRQGYELALDLSDSSHGVVTARLPTGKLTAPVSCTIPAKS